MLISLATGDPPEQVAERIGDGGGGALKKALTEALNEKLRPLRAERTRLEKDPAHIRQVLLDGVDRACAVAHQTLTEVRRAMHMEI
jgi:tryptophanyl-tRNA synthetase